MKTATEVTALSPGDAKKRADKLREKRMIRKEKRKAILAQVKTVAVRPAGTAGVSANWEQLKSAMGIKENQAQKHIVTKEEKNKNNKELTKVVALDCEMVGVGSMGREHMLARVTLVNMHCNVVYDKYVKPREPVVDFRTKISGIRPEHLQNGVELSVVQKEVSDILNDRILVGHDLKHDFDVMFLSHPNRLVRDTSLYPPFREMFAGRTPSLKNLVLRVLDINVQDGEHCSAQDAQVAMKLYLKYRNQWEQDVKKRTNRQKRKEQLRKEKQASNNNNKQTTTTAEATEASSDEDDEGTSV